MKKWDISLPATFLWLGIFYGSDILLPAQGTAGWPDRNCAGIQPALVSALAFTSLLLVLIHIFRGKKKRAKPSADPERVGAPRQGRTPEIDAALERMFTQQVFPMAKLSLSPCRILDATPPLYQALGYPKQDFLLLDGVDLGIFKEAPETHPRFLKQGWNESSAALFDRQSGRWRNCRILNILNRSGQEPVIISIVSGLSDEAPEDPLPRCISDILAGQAAGP